MRKQKRRSGFWLGDQSSPPKNGDLGFGVGQTAQETTPKGGGGENRAKANHSRGGGYKKGVDKQVGTASKLIQDGGTGMKQWDRQEGPE